MLAALEHSDVGDRVLVEHDEVSELAGSELTELTLQADGISVMAGPRDDRLHGRVAAILDEDLELLGVQIAMRRERIVAGIGPDQELDAELARLVHQLAKEIEVPLHATDVELHLLGGDLLAELDPDGPECGGRSARPGRPGHRPADR